MNFSAGFAFTCPFKTNSGNKALEHLPVELSGLNAFKPLIVTSKELTGQKAIRTLTGAFGDSGMTLGVFDGVTDKADLSLVAELKDNFGKGQYDSIIALGGDVVVDVAKILNLAVALKTADVHQLSGEMPVRSPLGPFVVIPTAATTGMETSKFAFLNRKSFVSTYLMPNLVMIDSRLIRANDGKTIAQTGLAAFGLALEASVAPDRNPFMDAYAIAALSFIRENLMQSVKRPGNKKAALAVANAVAMSGCVISNTTRDVLQRLGHIFHEMVHVHPGVVIGMAMPIVLADCLKEDAHLGTVLFRCLTGDDEYVATPEEKRGDKAMSILGAFQNDLYGLVGGKMPRNLKEAGIPQYMMDDIFDVVAREPDGSYLRTVIDRVGGNSAKS